MSSGSLPPPPGPEQHPPPMANNYNNPSGGGGGGGGGGGMAMLPTSFVEDPAGYLASIASQSPSRVAFTKLAGQVASFIASGQGVGTGTGGSAMAPPAHPTTSGSDGANNNDNNTPPVSQIASLYLQAAATQLMGGVAVGDLDQEMMRAQQQYEILEAVSVAATQCHPRSAISNSGILPTLGHLMLNNTNTVQRSVSVSSNNGNGCVGGSVIILQHAHVEFLHCCVLAEQYRYAERLMRTDSWPRPTSMVSSKQVLRYFYLRGIVHLGCNHYRLAHRCFWTCLTVPAEVSSKIAIAAWKKLVLVQCLLQSKTTPAMKGATSTTGGNGSGSSAMEAMGFTEANIILSQPPPMASFGGSGGGSSSATTMTYTTLPKTMPNCLGRFLMSYRDAAATAVQERSRQRRQQQQQQPPQQQGQPHEGQRQSQQQQQVLNPISCYMDVSKAFYTRNQAAMKELEDQYQQTFQEDGNQGLVRQCQTKLIHMQVAHLSRVYSVVPLTKLAELLLPAPAATSATELERIQRVTRILCQAQIPCDIQDDGMVMFPSTEDDEDYDEYEEDHPSLSLSDLSEWMSLMEKVQNLDVAMVTNSKYHAALRKDTGELAASAVGPRGVDDL